MKNTVYGVHAVNAISLSHRHAMQSDSAHHEIQPGRLPPCCDPAGGMPRGGAVLSDLAANCAFALYRFAGRAGAPLVHVLLQRRAAAGREDPARLGERWGPGAGLTQMHRGHTRKGHFVSRNRVLNNLRQSVEYFL
jgi:hypothetical protein